MADKKRMKCEVCGRVRVVYNPPARYICHECRAKKERENEQKKAKSDITKSYWWTEKD